MEDKALYIFVEGSDDERFFRNIVEPHIDSEVRFIKYAQMKKKIVVKYLNGIRKNGDEYIFTADLDEIDYIAEKKNIIKHKYEELGGYRAAYLDLHKIAIVVVEIESWYFAGLDDSHSLKFNLKPIANTENVTKEMFNLLYHGKIRSRIDFMYELMKVYSIETAKKKNKSFRYFAERYFEC